MKSNFFSIAILTLLSICHTAISKELTFKEYDSLEIRRIDEYYAYFTFPVVLVYSKEGVLVDNIFGRKIYDIKSYKISKPKLVVSSPSSFQLSHRLDKNIDKSKKTLIYVGLLNICPPCKAIKSEFDKKLVETLKSDYNIIEIQMSDK